MEIMHMTDEIENVSSLIVALCKWLIN